MEKQTERGTRTHRTKVWFALFLVLAWPAVVQAQFTFITNNGAITITRYTGPGGNVIIPSTKNGLPVTSIDYMAFFYCLNLTNVTIPNSITNIGNNAFEDCTNLTTVTIGNNVTSIGNWAFEFCGSLTNVTIPNSVTTIGQGAFSDCTSLTNVTIGNCVTSIADSAFYGTSLTSVMIPNSVTNIGEYAFYNCPSLTSITVDTNNPSYSSVAGVLFNQNQTVLIAYPEGLKGSYAIPSSVISIGGYAFYNCTNLTNVTISNSVTTIGDWAFTGCSLTSVTIGNGVTNIGSYAFDNCTSLTNVTIPGNVTEIGSAAFSGCPVISLTIPNSVRSIDIWAFGGCSRLTSLMLSDGITNIGSFAFDNCTSLTNVAIPGSVRSVGSYAFYGCSNLATLIISNGVASLGDYGFFGCGSLTNVFIPASMTNIGVAAFTSCTGLTGFAIDALNPAYSTVDGVLFDKNQSTLVEFPAGLAGNYSIPDSVINIGSDAFYFCTGLTSVIMGTNVTSIGDSAFCACTSLATVNIPIGVTSISNYAFYECPSLTRITIPNGVASIAYNAFAFTGVTNVTIPASVTNINVAPPAYYPQQGAFYGCSNLKGVFFQGNAPSGGDSYSFSGGTQAIAYYLPGTTGWSAFSATTGVPTVLWNPQAQTSGTSFGVHGNGFGFNITGTINIPIAVEACTNLGGTWTPLLNCKVTNGSILFSDLNWTNYPARFYRISSQ
jgi:hypothetical protein